MNACEALKTILIRAICLSGKFYIKPKRSFQIKMKLKIKFVISEQNFLGKTLNIN